MLRIIDAHLPVYGARCLQTARSDSIRTSANDTPNSCAVLCYFASIADRQRTHPMAGLFRVNGTTSLLVELVTLLITTKS